MAPSQSPRPWPMVGSHPGLRAGSWRKLGTCPSPAAGFIGGLDVSTPNHSPLRLKKQIYSKCQGQGRPGQASKPGPLQQEFLSLQKRAVASAFLLASDWLEGPSFRRAESAHQGGQWTATLVARRMETARARVASRSRLETAPEQGLPTATAPTQSLGLPTWVP